MTDYCSISFQSKSKIDAALSPEEEEDEEVALDEEGETGEEVFATDEVGKSLAFNLSIRFAMFVPFTTKFGAVLGIIIWATN